MKNPRCKPVETFAELPYYEQDSGANITYQFVVTPGTLGLMSAGRVRAKGPTTKALDRHDGWDQIYIILKGAGTIILGKRKVRVGPGTIVRIPQKTLHGVLLGKGEKIEYIYVNAFADRKALDGLLRMLK
jgi:mannose-6-phosphate isomerase-like protein (cupin superfamily)